MKSVLLLYQWERYEGITILGIFSDNSKGEKLAVETAEKYLSDNPYMKYAPAGITLERFVINSGDESTPVRDW